LTGDLDAIAIESVLAALAAAVVSGLLMEQATWRQLPMAWKLQERRSLSLTGCEFLVHF